MIALWPWALLLILVLSSLIPLGVHLVYRAPRMPITDSPAKHGLDFTSIQIPTVRGRSLSGWFLPSPGASKTLLILHGWGSNAEQMLPLATAFHRCRASPKIWAAPSTGYNHSTRTAPSKSLCSAIQWVVARPCSRRPAILGSVRSSPSVPSQILMS